MYDNRLQRSRPNDIIFLLITRDGFIDGEHVNNNRQLKILLESRASRRRKELKTG